MPKAVPMVQPVIIPQRSVQVITISSANSLPSDIAPNISICDTAMRSTAAVIRTLPAYLNSSASVVRSVSLSASRKKLHPPKEKTVSAKTTAAAGA